MSLDKGDGTFSPSPARMLEGFKGGIVPLDFNHDGRLDYLSISQKWGAAEARNPNVLFNEAWYLSQNSDVARAVGNGTVASGYQHYLSYGWVERRNPSVRCR